MYWQRDQATTTRVTRFASSSEGRPFEAIISLKFTVMCPVCRTSQMLEQSGNTQAARDDWAAADGRYYWVLPNMRQYWEECGRGLAQEACCECGTVGILPAASVAALYAYATKHSTDKMLCKALEELGFEVDRVNHRFYFVGTIPAENEVVLSA